PRDDREPSAQMFEDVGYVGQMQPLVFEAAELLLTNDLLAECLTLRRSERRLARPRGHADPLWQYAAHAITDLLVPNVLLLLDGGSDEGHRAVRFEEHRHSGRDDACQRDEDDHFRQAPRERAPDLDAEQPHDGLSFV